MRRRPLRCQGRRSRATTAPRNSTGRARCSPSPERPEPSPAAGGGAILRSCCGSGAPATSPTRLRAFSRCPNDGGRLLLPASARHRDERLTFRRRPSPLPESADRGSGLRVPLPPRPRLGSHHTGQTPLSDGRRVSGSATRTENDGTHRGRRRRPIRRRYRAPRYLAGPTGNGGCPPPGWRWQGCAQRPPAEAVPTGPVLRRLGGVPTPHHRGRSGVLERRRSLGRSPHRPPIHQSS